MSCSVEVIEIAVCGDLRAIHSVGVEQFGGYTGVSADRVIAVTDKVLPLSGNEAELVCILIGRHCFLLVFL